MREPLKIYVDAIDKDTAMPEERKLVTILFADVTGSTSLGDTLDPEDVRALMSRYYTHARRVIPSYGGTLEKFIGDAVMAVFGLTQAHGDDAERALAGAMALQEAVRSDTLLMASFSLRIGISTGEVIATSDSSSGDFLITGDAVNVAARLQQMANPGEIVVGERTVNAARTAFHFEDARLVEIRGKRQPLHVYPLQGARNTRKVERPPFVGRRQDLLQLSVLQARVIEEQQPQLVSLLAPAGTGKSRLIEEFLSRLDPADGFKVATVRCLPYGQTLTYWPLRSLLNELLGAEVSRERVIQALMQSGYSQKNAAHITDQALIALGVERDGAIERDCIFSAWRTLLEVFAQQAPRVIIIEDLHWASDSLLDMMEYIIHLRIQAPVLLITLSRPELLDRRPTWGGGHQNFTSLALPPLTTAQTRDLVNQLAQHLSPETRESIVERAGGNPFFALELLRGLSERASTGQDTTSQVLPDTVHAAVLARLDHLTTQERLVLQVASVISRPFRSSMLQALLDSFSEQELDTALDGLLIRDFIQAAEAGAFAFRHILIRDVVYGTLSRQERIRLHSRIAGYIEAKAGEHLDEYAELIAYHYREAIVLARQSAIPLDSPIGPEQAIRYLRRAGELAGRSGAFADAYHHLRNALDIAPESEQVALYEQLGDSLIWGDRTNEAYEKALALWREGGESDQLMGARLMRKLLICYTRGYSSKERSSEYIQEMRTEAQRLAEAAGDEDELWRIRVTDLFNHFKYDELVTESIDAQKQTALKAAEHFKQTGDWSAFSEAYDGYASISMRIGDYKEALAASEQRLTAPELSALERGDAIKMIAKAYMLLGDYDNVITTIQDALIQIGPGQPLVHLGSGISYAINAAFLNGRWSVIDEILPALEEMWQQAQYDPGAMSYVVAGYYDVLQVALAREDQATIDKAVSILKRIFPDPTCQEQRLLSGILTESDLNIDDGLVEMGLRPLLAAVIFCNERGIAGPESLLVAVSKYHGASSAPFNCTAIARALAARDNVQLEQTINTAEANNLVVHAARMRIVLAQRTGDKTHLELARPLLERLGDRHFLRRLEEVAASLESGRRQTTPLR